LRSWTPRRPSGKLKQRIFEAPAGATAGAEAESSGRWLRSGGWAWLCPAVACLIVAVAMTERTPLAGPVNTGATNALFASLALSNQLINAAQTNTATHDHNHWHVATFVSTKGGRSLSSMGSLPVFNTNNLMFKQ
jgi:hypothetical protein